MFSCWLYILFSLLRLEIYLHNFDIFWVKMDVCLVSFVDFFHERGDFTSLGVLAGIIKNNVGILHLITSTGIEANMHLRELRKNYWKHYSTFLQRDSLFAYASEIGAYAYSFFDELIQNDLLLYFTNNNFFTFVSTNPLHF